MDFTDELINLPIKSHRHAKLLLEHAYTLEWESVKNIINSIKDEDIENFFKKSKKATKSVAGALNLILKERFLKETTVQWKDEVSIFKTKIKNATEAPDNPDENKSPWAIDFASKNISIEVAFNNAGSAAWNLVKPVLASEINHVEKEIETKIGIIICATNELKTIGGIDRTVATFSDYQSRLIPMQNLLTTPVLLLGLKQFENIYIKQTYNAETKKIDGELLRIKPEETKEEFLAKCKAWTDHAIAAQKADKRKKKTTPPQLDPIP